MPGRGSRETERNNLRMRIKKNICFSRFPDRLILVYQSVGIDLRQPDSRSLQGSRPRHSPPEPDASWPKIMVTNLNGFITMMVAENTNPRKMKFFEALFKISIEIVLLYYIFYYNFLWLVFSIILSADLISDSGFWFVWFVTPYILAKEIKTS